MNNQTSKRLSAVQKNILFSLYGLMMRKGIDGPVPAMKMLMIVNSGRLNPVADTNFRRSCHTLMQNGLLNKYRDRQSLMLAFSLTRNGIELAKRIYDEKLNHE